MKDTIEEIMKNLVKLSFVVVAVTIVTLLTVGQTVYADGPRGNGGMMGMGGSQNSLVASAAKTLGMSQTDLITALQSGKTPGRRMLHWTKS
jgi:hypothetical protein